MAKKRKSKPEGRYAEDPERSEKALVQKLQDRVSFPSAIADSAQDWTKLEQYVHTDAMHIDEDDAVSTNYVFRNQQASLSMLLPEAPAPRIKTRRWMAPEPEEGGEMDNAGRNPFEYPRELIRYARTHEIIVEHQQAVSGMEEIIEGLVQDAHTLPVVWVKLRMQEDFELDTLGYARNNDQLDAVKRYERLYRDHEAGVFTDDAPEYEELQTLDKTIRAFALDHLRTEIAGMEELAEDEEGRPLLDDDGDPVMVGAEDLQEKVRVLVENPSLLTDMDSLPEIGHYIGPVFQQVHPLDLRWDWNIKRVEDLRYARWMAQRSLMTPADIREKWGLSDEELSGAVWFDSDGKERTTATRGAGDDPEYGGKDDESLNPSGDPTDTEHAGDMLAVWEYWDRVQGRVFRWVQGMGRFLDSFVPDALPTRFFPFFALTLNRMTGTFVGRSDVEFQMSLQEEINRQRTWDREAEKSQHPRFLTAKGLLKPAEKARAAEASPYEIIEVERLDDIKDKIVPLLPQVHTEAPDRKSDARLELQQMAGVPSAALGAGNTGMTATSDAIANEQLGNRTAFRKKQIRKLYAELYKAMMELNAQVLTEEAAIEIAGPGAFFPPVDRQALMAHFAIECDATMNDPAERSQEMTAWVNATQIFAQLRVPIDGIPVAKRIFELMGIRENLGDYISVPALMQMLGGPEGAPGPGAPPAQGPEDQGPRGAEGGHPEGVGLSAPPDPGSVPNRPV